MLSKLRKRTSPLTEKLASLVPSWISPNVITVLGIIPALIYLYLIWQHKYLDAVLALVITGLFDVLDGAIARRYGRVSKIGALLDSSLDRLADVILALGIPALGAPWELAYLWATGSILISTIRAAAEIEGIKGEGVGLMERSDRIVALAIIILVKMMELHLNIPTARYTIAIIAGVTALIWVTVIQRMWSYKSPIAIWIGSIEISLVSLVFSKSMGSDLYGILGVTGVLAYAYLAVKWKSLEEKYPMDLLDAVMDAGVLLSFVELQGTPSWLFYIIRLLRYSRALRGRPLSSTPSVERSEGLHGLEKDLEAQRS